ncbi:rhodanese domain-containing protein CG4456-like [Galleria mellonella]|uniref:Rhodanese domain-containing protein CG4456-like n=1 Tax=Galleria mellonella TaxID=7137 RepID=A0A6J1WST9_GALME|nr:rhodanese domain-containing protein CG4456-like [Galleria mellonella]
MFSRIFLSTIPSSIKIVSAVTLRNSKECFGLQSICCIPSTNLVTKYRTYSDHINPEEMIVDYEHVKKATSANNILIVDVREPDEIKEHGKIPNSINIPLGNVSTVLSTMSENEFKQIYNRSKPCEDTEIIFYCMIGKRSGMAQQNALNLGYKNVKNYLGSWTEWATKGN